MTTKKPRANGVIRFSPVAPRACDLIRGGTVVAKADCPVFEEPIGWVVRSPGYDPPGELKLSSEAWHFAPTCSIEPVLSGFQDKYAVWTAVRKQYRGIYDREPPKGRKWVASGDDCEIDSMILEWCGLNDIWNGYEFCWDYSVIGDVLDWCESVECTSREWYGGGPGLSGIWYSVYTENPSLLQREIRKKIEEIVLKEIAKPPRKTRRSSKTKKPQPKEGAHSPPVD